MTKILFVCTGNVFRSLTAEYSFRSAIGLDSSFNISSAGTGSNPDLQIREDVADYLMKRGLDVSSHKRRFVTQELVDQTDLVIAMNTDHKTNLMDRFSANAPLFMELAGGVETSLPDIDDLFHPDDWHGEEAWQHIQMTIDKIIDMSPTLLDRIVSKRS